MSGYLIDVFDPKKGPPPFPEYMIPFYQKFIPAVCLTEEAKATAYAALEARDRAGLEAILKEQAVLNQGKPSSDELSEDEMEVILKDLGML